MDIVKLVFGYLLSIFFLLLIGTMIISWIRSFSRGWTPKGLVLVIVETVLTITDPPLKFLRRYIRPLRIGTVSLDLSFMVLFIVVLILLSVTGAPIL
ncbi:MAG TPA: YggT family protein [Trebonia sp.]